MGGSQNPELLKYLVFDKKKYRETEKCDPCTTEKKKKKQVREKPPMSGNKGVKVTI